MSEETLATTVVEVPVKRFEMPAEDEPIQKPSEPEKETATEAKTEETVTTEVETPDQPEKQPVKPGKNSFERKIDKLYKAAAEERSRADTLQRQIDELKPQPIIQNDGLTLESFDYDVEKYAEARIKKAEELAIKRYTEEQQASRSRSEEQELASEWEQKATKAEDKYEDFDEVVGVLQPTNPVFRAIMQADNGEDIAYHLGKNMEEARRILSLDPVRAIREIGKLEVKLAATQSKEKAPSKAPAPIAPVSGKTGVLTNDLSDDDDIGMWIKKRSKQVRG